MRSLATFFILLAAFAANAQLGTKANQSGQITGLWQNDQFGYQMTLMLNADGTGEFDGEPVRYTAKNTVLALTTSAGTVNYNFVHNGNSLTVSGGDLEQAVTFTKAGSGNADTNSAPNNTPPTTSGSSTSGIDKSLLGAWSGNNESMEFKPDGTCLYAGHTFKYTAANAQISLTTQQGTTVIPYTVRNNQLVINVNGQDYTYSKGNATSATQSTPAGAKNVAQELVGKWCWINVTNTNSGGSSSDTCITLNGDGTYVYYSERSMSVNDPSFSGGTNSQNSDRGTWWVQGDRIFYNSQSQGQGSYRLEKRNHPKNVNDPMIVLDGQPFVTQYQKAPWR